MVDICFGDVVCVNMYVIVCKDTATKMYFMSLPSQMIEHWVIINIQEFSS